MPQFRVRCCLPPDRMNDEKVIAILKKAAGCEPSGKDGSVQGMDYFFPATNREEAQKMEQRIGDTGHVCFHCVETKKD